MMIYLLVLCVCSLFIKQSQCYYTQQWVLHVDGGSDVADAVARDHGFVNLGEIFEDYYHFQHRKVAKRSVRSHAGKKALLAADTRVRWAQQQKAKKRVKRDLRLQDSDPRWPSMWYLNRGNGLDMNVIPAWLEGITGKGAVVTILDDGLEKDHPDLVQNYDPMASYDVNNQDPDPSPRYDMIDSNRHGTRCAGEVAATSNNSVCALGVAHGAQVGGVRMLDGDVTDAVEARSLSLNPQHIDIYSASWGPDDDGKTVDGPGELATRAFIEGVTKGRNGKGSIFIWASGNGGRDHDNCNCDGYTNSIYSLSISSATEQGHVPWYSEACSSTLASTYSSGAVGEKQVVTTDLHHSCTSSHTGTSASAPLAAGICALALEANPKLTWRDMQHIVVRTARPQNLIARDWQTNGVGRNVSHSFGYGLMDAYAMVQLARTWETVPEQHKCEITASHGEKQIPAKSVVVLNLQVTECEGVQVLEHVQAKLTIYSHRRGDLNIQLTSPIGTRVTLLAHRPHDMTRAGFSNWPFMSVHSWGESPIGIWQLEIHNDGRFLVEFRSWDLILYGTATPPVADSTTTSFNKPTVPQEVPNNSVDDDTPPLKTWSGDAEIRKDTSEVEEDLPQVNAISGCEKSNGRLCIECEDGLFVFEGKCVDKCPERYYPSTLETKIKDTAEEIGSTKKVCLSCHYTCRICSGSNDYQCTECYPDAILTNPKESESYCYPLSMRVKIEDEKWYFRIFMLLTFFFVIFFILLVLWYIRYRKDMSYRFTGIDSSDEKIREMERKVRTAIYSDSE
ncbi:furin-like protease 1 isoform X2 [Onthophagus taurus]|uniref:furin-like protease 1 isoform X2 n=1 Tax=Onthophagus taurus TaxID=166361 RepID=UPI000C1FE5AB|nr:furin-like protease 1 isoform X2 [Onthophagus taurus]